MKISPALKPGVLLKRYKRFLADIQLPGGEAITAHCPNTGSMKNCIVPDSPCWYSLSSNPKRKLPATLEITTTPSGALVGVNTQRPNHLVEEAIINGVIEPLQGYTNIRREVRYGNEKSRIDLLLEREGECCYVEVKNATLESDHNLILFPDAVTTRGTKHLRELISMKQAGHRAVLVFCVQHSAAQAVAPAFATDPTYCATLQQAIHQGVEVLAYKCSLSANEITIEKQIPFILEPNH